MNKNDLNEIKEKISNSKGLLDQLNYNGERNTIIMFNVLSFLNQVLAKIEVDLEKSE